MEANEIHSLWHTRHRGNLHDISSWNLAGTNHSADDAQQPDSTTSNPISLTYVGSGAAACGAEQLRRLFSFCPASIHLFNSSQWTRFNNRVEIIASAYDPRQRIVAEEIAVSALHHERMDWLLPGVAATNRPFLLNFVIVANYARNAPLLEQVHVYWDQTSLHRQLGMFENAFSSLIAAAGKNAASLDHALESLRVIPAKLTANQLMFPNPATASKMFPMEIFGRSCANGQASGAIKMSPIGGLDSISELVQQLPILATTKPVATSTAGMHHNPLLASSGETISARPLANYSAGTAFKSTIQLGDNFNDAQVSAASSQHTHLKPVFGTELDGPQPFRPSIAVDSARLHSNVFDQSPIMLKPSIKTGDVSSRFGSSIFDSPAPTGSAQMPPTPYRSPQLSSSVFMAREGERDAPGLRPTPPQATVTDCRPFGTDEDVANAANQTHAGKPVNMKCYEGHFKGSGFEQTEPVVEERSYSETNIRHSMTSTISLAPTDDKTSPPPPTSHSARNRNQSSIFLSDSEIPLAKPTSRVLQPPGGRSTLILE